MRALRIGIVGSRDYPGSHDVTEFVDRLPGHAVVVSGGAEGPDSWAERAALDRGLEFVPRLPQAPGAVAKLARNVAIVEDVTVVVAFWDGKSRGTLDTIKHALALGRKLWIKRPRQPWKKISRV